MGSNFDFLKKFWPDLTRLGASAEESLYKEPDKTVRELQRLGVCTAQKICIYEKVQWDPKRAAELLHQKNRIPAEISRLLTELAAGTPDRAETLIHSAYTLSCWFMTAYGDAGFRAPAYTAPGNPVTMELSMLQALNFAMQQNGIAPVQSVTLHNHTGSDMENLDLEIVADPEFSVPLRQHIDCIPAGQSVVISKPALKMSGEFLSSVTEKVSGLLRFSLMDAGKEIARYDGVVKVLAYDEWHGSVIYPELLASFVTPNHPGIGGLLTRASQILGQWTDDPSLDAYLTQNPNRVILQAAAIFAAIKEQKIAYAIPPASFESMGQRVRMCDMVLQQKLGTCLDLSLLYASCLEAAGLHPLLILTNSHAFVGLWTQEGMFPEPVQDDVALLTKRMAAGIDEIAVMETTCAAAGNNADFDGARNLGERYLTTKTVEAIIDVYRARISGVLPLPLRVRTESGWALKSIPTPVCRNTAPERPAPVRKPGHPVVQEQIPRKVQWERKLLDLGLRNNLINLRLTKTQLPILATSLNELEDALAGGKDFSIWPRPSDCVLREMTFEAMSRLGSEEIIRAEFRNRRLRSAYTEAELASHIKDLYRSARMALEENGANTLYLALGMLRWYESKQSTKARYAPIILLPVEMVRKSAVQGYVIRLRDEEPQMNITLLEKLKQDFGIVVEGLDPLPADEHGIDILQVMTVMRKAVMEENRWDVLECAAVGIFSFSQFVMWNDIRNRTQDLMNNKIVSSLMEGKLTWDAKPLEMGERVPEDDVLLPMPADASQLYAIEAACAGESFVLHGPPGTGKSQTITSLIANALAKGKSVLFVAEKMAALEVVQRRLEEIGIGPFCLELHSNKSKKKDVLEQLRQATEVTRARPAQAFAQKAQELSEMRKELDGYAKAMNQVQPCGSTLFSLISEYESVKDAPPIAAFSRDFLEKLDSTAIEKQKLLVERLVAAAREIGHPHDHPLQAVTCRQYSQQLRTELEPCLREYLQALECIEPPVDALVTGLQLPPAKTWQELQQLGTIASQLSTWYDLPSPWAQAQEPEAYFTDVTAMAEHFEKARALHDQLRQTFREELFTQDGQQLLQQFVEASEKWFLPKAMELNRLRKRLSLFADGPIEKDSLQEYLTALRDCQDRQQSGNVLLQKYGNDLAWLNRGPDTDWELVRRLAQTARQSAEALRSWFGSCEFMHRCCGKPQYRQTVQELLAALPVLTQAKQRADGLLGLREIRAENYLQAQKEQCRSVLGSTGSLKEWITYSAIAWEVQSAGLANVVSAYENGASHATVLLSYRRALVYGLICMTIEKEEGLQTFSGAVFHEKIQQYRRADAQWRELSRQEVYCRLAAQVPNFTAEAAHSSELGILQRCIKSGGRGISIRRLFDQIPNLLPRLCPCMLMSPISAAQYLDPKREPFDLVVFDEASQLPTCKAVGVLARGKNAVIVGDPKQMPPTSFFAVNAVDEDNLEEEDLESILDDCLALNMPQSHLLWHYRSRHESLIAFSNSRFYENRLFTFPSVNDRERKVRLVHVDGVFERGKGRRNQAEAQAVVEELRRRCHDPALSGFSVGVVTFNISQQNLIDDLLNEACKNDQELEKWAFGSREPVFIKNLENVQGDERDVILFSVGYGPDENGKVYMNFGPLNREGGWRRLNVAVTRARSEMVVYATLKPDQIDLNRTKAEGVAALRAFLEYAEGRELALDAAAAGRTRTSDSGLAEVICRALSEKGYETQRSVGRSAYRIDIGVVDPEHPDRYLLGILLDGPAYGAARTTRDRELGQTSVLESLGWNLMRIWSMDWWDNRDKELQRILTKLEQLRKTVPQKVPKPVEKPVIPRMRLIRDRPIPMAPVYRPARLAVTPIPSEEFTEPKYNRDLRSRIQNVLRVEAPVSQSVLEKRVIQSCGLSRAGSRIQSYLRSLLSNVKRTYQDNGVFCWLDTQDPRQYAGLRVSSDDEDRRDIRDVSVQEVANAVCLVLYEQVGMVQEDLLRETARKLGYARMGGNLLSAIEAGIRCALSRDYVEAAGNGTLSLTEAGMDHVREILKSF